MLKINEVAKLTGITVRTLHYYDEIGLLKPGKITDCGYRLYDTKDLEQLQQILFFRELDFPLKDIKEMMTNPLFDRTDALRKQEELLLQKRERLNNLINLVRRIEEGEETMSFKEFDQSKIEKQKKEYAKEVKERWGKTKAYEESLEKTKEYNPDKWSKVDQGMWEIVKEFCEIRKANVESEEVQQLVKKWQNYITKNYYTCTKEILSGLGQMYIVDERFKKNMDQFGEGTAQFMSDAIAFYCTNK